MSLQLTPYVAELKRRVYDGLMSGNPPEGARFDARVFESARDLGQPQMGASVFSPSEVRLEFIYRNSLGANVVVSFEFDAPERIVFMPVPVWVVQTIWQGEVDGSYRFESEAAELLRRFEEECSAGTNDKWFESQLPTTRT